MEGTGREGDGGAGPEEVAVSGLRGERITGRPLSEATRAQGDARAKTCSESARRRARAAAQHSRGRVRPSQTKAAAASPGTAVSILRVIFGPSR